VQIVPTLLGVMLSCSSYSTGAAIRPSAAGKISPRADRNIRRQLGVDQPYFSTLDFHQADRHRRLRRQLATNEKVSEIFATRSALR
jgi:hypothetical protein